ncbi:MAG TPA: metallophosphoesterase [Spirochaetia bacterium]|nr:metallophosphoesterase [Spirochaetia bacterium]
MLGEDYSWLTLSELFNRTKAVQLRPEDRFVIFSDLHLGNGGRLDDFRHNSELFESVLDRYYLRKKFGLILNGDVDELERFGLDEIRCTWGHIYNLFSRFQTDTALFRLIGNHDLILAAVPNESDEPRPNNLEAPLDALRFRYGENDIFIFHGHQTKKAYSRPNPLVRLSLRYIANPLRIRNVTVAHDSLKQFKTERRVYQFATASKVLSIIGHTHRPLFESMSKVDSIKFRVEQLCREYPGASSEQRGEIEELIDNYRMDLENMPRRDLKVASTSSLYNANLVVPCMFNSGCVIGKRGMTCIEISGGEIALVHWFDRTRSQKYLHYEHDNAERLDDLDFYRIEIKRDNLDYIFTRINLLTGRPPERSVQST